MVSKSANVSIWEKREEKGVGKVTTKAKSWVQAVFSH
jgi:hypothetical protein